MLVLTPAAASSPWVNTETNVAISLEPVSYTHLTLPTSDLSVDLGGRRIIKKKNKLSHT